MENVNMVKEIFNKIINSENILVTAHMDPDGDAIGSSLALYNYLKNINKKVDIFLKKSPSNFSFLSNFDDILTNEADLKEEYSAIICLDCGDSSRTNVELSKCRYNEIIVIDHHITHEKFSENTILDTDASATCQILFEIFKIMNIHITKEIGECLYSGLLTDTGSFRNANVIPATFQTAKELVELGVNANEVAQNVINTMSINKFELVKKALNSIKIIDNVISYLYLDKKTIKKYSQNEEDIHGGLVNYGRDIENIEVSIFIRQIDKNEYKVSMRSNRYLDVAQIAQKYGGGGHTRAAGIYYIGKLKDLENRLLNDIKESIKV